MSPFPTFLGFSGRIGRLDFWLGAAAAAAIAWLAFMALMRAGVPKPFASAAGDVVFLAAFLGTAVKRGNDRGHAAAATLALLCAVVTAGVGLAGLKACGASDSWIAGLTALAVALTVTALVDLGLMLAPDAPAAEPEEAALRLASLHPEPR